MANRLEKTIHDLLAKYDIETNGKRPWDLQIHDARFFPRVLSSGSIALGESYMDGWWDCEALDQFFHRILKDDIRAHVRAVVPAIAEALVTRLWNSQRKTDAFRNAQAHYDIGNDLYERMLGHRMVYTCGYWNGVNTLDDAQDAKLDLVCRKIGLKSGQRVLDIGCGWGSFAKFAAERYGATVVGITVSEAQVSLARERCAGLPVEIRLQDYRDTTGSFDHVISLGMVEHVGYKNYRSFMEVAARCLADDGLFLLHTIGGRESVTGFDPWMEKYIFPNAMLPSVKQLVGAAEGLFLMEDFHNFGPDYDRTLMAWCDNVESHWGELKGHYDERFHRMWRYYLRACAGSFRARVNQLWQMVFSKTGVVGGYKTVR